MKEIDFFKNDTRVFATITAAVTVATLFGCGLGYVAATKGPSLESPVTSNVQLASAVRAVKKLTKQGTPNFKIPVYFTDFDFIEKNGHAITKVNTKGCEVVLSNDFLNSEFNVKLKQYTGWDDEQASIFLAAHELQHCVTSEDVRQAAYSKASLTERQAHALHTFAWGTISAEHAAKHPGHPQAIENLRMIEKRDAFVRARESVSDITGLIMVQQLSKKGLTLANVEGLQKVRMETSPDPLHGSHHTVPALRVFATRLSLDESFGKYIAPQHVAEVAYQLVGLAKPESHLTKGTVEDLKKARESYISEHSNSTTFNM